MTDEDEFALQAMLRGWIYVSERSIIRCCGRYVLILPNNYSNIWETAKRRGLKVKALVKLDTGD